MPTFNINIIASALMLSSLASMTACSSYPTNTIVQGGQSSAIYFEAFPSDASIVVDGVSVGQVGTFDGIENTLAVSPGTHKVSILQNGAVLYEKEVYVGRQGSLKISR